MGSLRSIQSEQRRLDIALSKPQHWYGEDYGLLDDSDASTWFWHWPTEDYFSWHWNECLYLRQKMGGDLWGCFSGHGTWTSITYYDCTGYSGCDTSLESVFYSAEPKKDIQANLLEPALIAESGRGPPKSFLDIHPFLCYNPTMSVTNPEQRYFGKEIVSWCPHCKAKTYKVFTEASQLVREPYVYWQRRCKYCKGWFRVVMSDEGLLTEKEQMNG